MRKTIGILAHVDAGKTTFSERVLYLTQAIRHLGRVDHQDAFLDSHNLEKQRGITIFSGLASFQLDGDTYYWLDTPGHVDFSTEMERAISVMDYAVLIVSCAEGVQSHTETVWQLLKEYHVPVMIFLNKLDRTGADPDRVIQQMKNRLSVDIFDLRHFQTEGRFSDAEAEAIAERDEQLLDQLFDGGFDDTLWTNSLRQQMKARLCFPVMAGVALEGKGVSEFLRVMSLLTYTDHHHSSPLTARCYQVRHDPQGQRLCFLKLLSGTLQVKDELPVSTVDSAAQKINELRLYHGEKYRPCDTAYAGDIVAVPGLEGICPGDIIGTAERALFHTEPMMAADVLWDAKAIPAFRMMQALRILEDEEPTLTVTDTAGHIAVHVMGRIQLEVLRQLLQERFGFIVDFGPTHVLYRETIAAPAIGVGHYEPLRHYAECHLRLVPSAPGNGVTFRSLCHVDTLSLNWQRLIAGHVSEKQHKGVLTGAPLTDVEVQLLTGRAHLKHTEGGDFRQATYRAIRNALMYADSILLEPVAGFVLRAPSDLYGSLAGALSRLQADVDVPEYDEDSVILRGECPYAVFSPWQEDFLSLTHGRGSLRVWMSRYAPCRDQQSIVEQSGYNPLADDTPDSVFCSHGAGFTVPWNEVRSHMHMSHEDFL
ncbi:MAG: TetM/TetW/TetO/TetS family tetracycline resistance ribosomal protection protein [Clostridia bacterium]|nr:TetM/TetW/TetO/TetS family tetracycline resistance ribosomal protection protein [Clostridia bacterium]